MPTDPQDHPEPDDPIHRRRLGRYREEERDETREKIESIFVELICVQHLLVFWYLQAGFEHRLRNHELTVFDRIYADFERAYDCSRSSETLYLKLSQRLTLLGERYGPQFNSLDPRPIRTHEVVSFHHTARKALEMPHKILMPVIWGIEKLTVDKAHHYYHENLLNALHAKRRLIEDLNGIHTDKLWP